MSCNSFRSNSVKIFTVGFTCIAILYLFSSAFRFEEKGANQKYFKIRSGIAEKSTVQENVSSNDFSLTHKGARDENAKQTSIYNLRTEKLLRKCIFDIDTIIILTLVLSRFTHSAYQLTLPPLWHPSIPIAHRRLII